jgi:hypothetical protein
MMGMGDALTGQFDPLGETRPLRLPGDLITHKLASG